MWYPARPLIAPRRNPAGAAALPADLMGAIIRYGAVALILVVFLALGVLYSVVTPPFEAAEEPWHYGYIKRLAAGEGLPPIVRSADAWKEGVSNQPPLYYVLGSWLIRGIESGPADRSYALNPHAVIGSTASAGNKNVVVHLGGEDFPYRGVTLAVRVLRWFSLCCAAMTVLLTYLSAGEITAHRLTIPIGATALLAFNPQFIFSSAAATSDALAVLLATALLYLGLRVCNGHQHPYGTPLLLGLGVGAAALIQQSGLLTALLVLGAYVIYALRQRPRRWGAHLVRPVLIAWGVAAAASGWWYVRSALLYPQSFALPTVPLALDMRSPAQFAASLLGVAGGSISSYWALFGWLNVPADDVYYVLIRIFSGLSLMGGLLVVARIRWRRQASRSYRWRPALLAALWTVVSLGVYLTQRPLGNAWQGKALFPAGAAIAFFLAMGLSAWLMRRYALWLTLLIAVLLAGVAGIMPLRYIAPAYAPPERLRLSDLPSTMQDLNVRFGDELFLLGYEVREESTRPGEALRLRLYWVGRKRMSENYTFNVHVLGREGKQIGQVESYAGAGNYPTRLWLPGEVVRDDYAIPLSAAAEVPVAGAVRVGVYTRADAPHLVAMDPEGRRFDHDPEIARVRIIRGAAARLAPQKVVQANLGHQAILIGYDLTPPVLIMGNPWEITLYWRALVQTPQDYTVFMHLINEREERVAQMDEQPLRGDFATRFWRPDEIITDPHRFPLPAGLPGGNYRLRVGLYLLENGERLPVIGSNPPTTYITIGPVYIEGR